ncbi:MAG: thioredoxin [Clostridia bacterium]|nr:thioredoxin [Clostridia bacterium]
MSILHLTPENFKSTIESASVPVLVDFFADWCMPCKMFAPILEKVSEKADGKVIIAKINIDDAEQLAAEYHVMSIPTIILFKDGKEAARNVGAMSAGDLMNFIGV